MAFNDSRFRVIKLVLMILTVPATIIGWGNSKVLGGQNLVLNKKTISTSKENSISPETQQGLYFRSVGKVPNLLLPENTFSEDFSKSIKNIPKLPELRKSVINDFPELLSKNPKLQELANDSVGSIFEKSLNSLEKDFVATAYSLKGLTACGLPTSAGVIAADKKVLPLGSIVKIEAGKYSGLYHVLDTGASIKGNRVDIYMACRSEAKLFGRRKVQVEVVRYGWGDSNKDILAVGQ
jgi:3D (Asp-Asp-Asp) domain-containing protein